MLLICILAFFAFSLWKLRFYKDFNVGCLSIDQCNSVKGFFIVIVFFSHINQYILDSGYEVNNWGDVLYFRIVGAIGQLMVVMFLFFSGYGIMESFKKKDVLYLSSMPRKRILTTLLNFDVAVVSYILLNLIIGKGMSMRQIFFSFIAWDSVGNSNWYIFCILICYLLAYIFFSVFRKLFYNSNTLQFAILSLFVVFVVVMILISHYKEPWWYNTMLCFPLGMLYSSNKDNLNRIVQKTIYLWISFFVILFLSLRLVIPYSLGGVFNILYNLSSMSFACIVVLLMMKVRSDNHWLQWLGARLFPLYIYQRFIMIAIYETPGGKSFIAALPLFYIIICFAFVLFVASHFYRWQISIK